tara:strand:- start:7971 stop:8585 length:615 start_codon:yes stop_codon:yes gene_type:complete
MQKWTAQRDEWLKSLYPDTDNRKIARIMGCSYSAIKNRAVNLGLKKSPEYLEREKPGCFSKGHRTWNKGKTFHSGGRSPQYQFKPGHKPANHKPLGTTRISKDGYLQRKVSDTGYPPADWKGEHIIRWEEYHGRDVPPNHIVRFSDGDKGNFDEDNLVLVSRAENAVLNKMFAMTNPPPGGFLVLLNLARIQLAAGKRKREIAE